MSKANVTDYKVGSAYSVALNLLLLPDPKLTVRFGVGINIASVKADIERQGQLIPCGAQLLSDEQKAQYPGKVLLLTEGVNGRYEIAKLLGRPLEVLIHSPKSDAGILDRAVASNGPLSVMSVMDISVTATRLEAQGYSEQDCLTKLSWVAGKGKPLGKQRFWQYKRLQGLPIAIQQMAHIGAIKSDAALHMTNRKLTEDQYTAIVAQAKDTRARLLHEQWEADQKYIEREKDVVLQAAMKGEAPAEPQYTPKKRAKTEGDALTTPEITDAMKELGISKKDDPRPDPNPQAVPGSPLTHQELMADLGKLKELGGLLVEVGECIESRILRKITAQDFCDQMKALVDNGSPKAKVKRREIREKAGLARPLAVVK